MAKSQDKLDITPKVIDLGAKVIQLSHVASAGYSTTHPYRAFGLISLAAGLGLIGYEFVMRGPPAFALQGGGAPMLWLAFGALGVGLFLVAFARRQFVIRTSDGRKTVIKAGDDVASGAIVAQIRDAMEAVGQPAADAIPLQRTLAGRTGTPMSQPAALGQPMARPQIAAQPPFGQPAAEPARRAADPIMNGAATRPGSGLREPLSAAEAAAIAQRRQLSQMPPTDAAPAFERQASYGSMAGQTGGGYQQPMTRERLSVPQTVPTIAQHDAGPQELRALVEHIKAADVQHKEALLELLRVVEDYYQERASREDAVAHWRSFADYVAQYLAEVDGLLMLTERYGRHMIAGR